MLDKLLSTPTAQLGRASRFVVFQIKLWTHCARLLIKNRSGQQAAALSYHTVFGIVPLAIVTLLMFQSFPAYSGVGEKVRELVYEQLQLSEIEYPNPTDPGDTVMLTEYLDSIVGRFFAGLNKGEVALFSTVIVIWAALALLSTIEKAFNNIWHVGRGRSFLNRVINYWALLTLGPLLLGVGIYASTRYTTLAQLQKTLLSSVTPTVFSYLVATAAFFLLYFVLPNTKVQAGAALWGAAVAALAWSLAKWGFGIYVTKFIPYNQVYGVLGLIPLGVFWVFVTWVIVLFGLHLTFTTQHLKSLDAAEIAGAKETEEYFVANDLTAISIMREIATAFAEDKAPVSGEVVCGKLNIPGEFGNRILQHFVNRGLIARTSEPKVGYIPAKDPANVKLSDISAIVAEVGLAQSAPDSPEVLDRLARSQREVLEQYTVRQIL
ncbi:MAG: YhjD/YihY/BrkB family envelope integrity protein [Planctomycetota bacterium]|jgi:membrane protein